MNRSRQLVKGIISEFLEMGSRRRVQTPDFVQGSRIAYGRNNDEFVIVGTRDGNVILKSQNQELKSISIGALRQAMDSGMARSLGYQLDSLDEMTSVGAIPAREQPMGILGQTGKKIDYKERLRRMQKRTGTGDFNMLPKTESQS